jgi:hypothetical protein
MCPGSPTGVCPPTYPGHPGFPGYGNFPRFPYPGYPGYSPGYGYPGLGTGCSGSCNGYGYPGLPGYGGLPAYPGCSVGCSGAGYPTLYAGGVQYYQVGYPQYYGGSQYYQVVNPDYLLGLPGCPQYVYLNYGTGVPYYGLSGGVYHFHFHH